MATSTGAPPNPYQSMATMPGPMPPKKDDKTEELMKAAHGVFKAMSKMDEMSGGSSADLAKAKKSLKDYVANVLKGDPSTLAEDSAPPPPSDNNTPPPDGPAPPPPDAPPPAA